MKKIKHYLKILSVGIAFSVFGIICLVGNLIFMPIIAFGLYRKPSIRKFARLCVFYSWKFFINFLSSIGYMKYRFEGLENLKEKSNLIIANHPSLLDVVFLLSHIKNANCIVKAELSKNIFLYPAIKASGYIPNTENEVFLEKGINTLINGENLIIFPEGTRTKEEIVFHKAAAYMGLKGAKYVTVIVINMQPRSLKKGQSWYNTPNAVINFELKVKDSIVVKDFLGNRPIPVMARKLNKNLVQICEKELKK